MKRLVFALFMALIFFAFLNFVYCNLDAETFGYAITFKFRIPYLLALESVPIPLGFVLLIAFCLGMVAIAFLEAMPTLFKVFQVREKNKRIRELERELTVVREMAASRQATSVEVSKEDGD